MHYAMERPNTAMPSDNYSTVNYLLALIYIVYMD